MYRTRKRREAVLDAGRAAYETAEPVVIVVRARYGGSAPVGMSPPIAYLGKKDTAAEHTSRGMHAFLRSRLSLASTSLDLSHRMHCTLLYRYNRKEQQTIQDVKMAPSMYDLHLRPFRL